MIKLRIRNLSRMRLTSRLASVAIVILVLGVALLVAHQVKAYVDGLTFSGVNPSCTQVTLVVNEAGPTDTSSQRSGRFDFSGSVSIPSINVSCATGNCDGTDNSYTLDLNSGAGYSSATPVTIDWTFTNTGSLGVTTPTFTSPGSFQLPACGASPPSGGGTTGTTTGVSLPPLDPPGTAPRVYGGYGNLGSEVVVYKQPWGYQFYSYTGVPVGQIDLGAVGIPGAGGLIASMSNDEFRADLFYDGGDYLRVKFFINGDLVEDGRFMAPGIGTRAGEVAGGGSGGSSGGGSATGGTLQVLCPQRLRLEASANSVIVDVLQPGDMLTVIGRSNDNTWFNVNTADSLTGWVFYGQCINVNSSSINNAPIEVEFAGRPTIGEQQAAPSGGQGIVQVSAPPGTPVVGFSCGQNLRSGPGNDYFVIRVIPTGSSMIVTGRSNDLTWVQLSAGTLNGWATLGGCASPIQGDVSGAPVLVDLSN
jgi:hypothetical protein